MTLPSFLAFVLISAAQVATPGPSTLFLVNNAVLHGKGRALLALSGDLLAIAILAGLSAMGVGALLTGNPVLFGALRLAGAAYLVVLGLRCFQPSRASGHGASGAATDADGTGARLWAQSFLVGISNPKAILFFSALFPQFLPVDGDHPGLLVLLVVTFVLTKLVVLAAYAVGAQQIKRVLRDGRSATVGRWVTGSIFLAFASAMAWSTLA